MSDSLPDPGRVVEPPEVASLLALDMSRGCLIEPKEGFALLESKIREGALDNYLDDWALGAKGGIRNTVLVHAIESNLPQVVSALLSRGADPNRGVVIQGGTRRIRASDYSTPLGLSGHSEQITRMLLDAGADVHLLSRGDPPLMYAVGKDTETGAVRAMLEAGADPLLQAESRSALAAALAVLPEGHEQLTLLRAAAAEQIKGKRKSSLSCKGGKNPVSTAEARGVKRFVEAWLEHDKWDWAISFVQAGRSETSEALHKLFPDSKLYAPAKQAIFDEHHPIFVVEFKGMPWTIVFDEIGGRELEGRLDEIGVGLSKALACEVLGFGSWRGRRYQDGVLVESHDSDWNPDTAYLVEETEDHDEDALDQIDVAKVQQVDQWFADKGVFLPDAGFSSDGLLLKLELHGIKRKDVVGHDVLVVKNAEAP